MPGDTSQNSNYAKNVQEFAFCGQDLPSSLGVPSMYRAVGCAPEDTKKSQKNVGSKWKNSSTIGASISRAEQRLTVYKRKESSFRRGRITLNVLV